MTRPRPARQGQKFRRGNGMSRVGEPEADRDAKRRKHAVKHDVEGDAGGEIKPAALRHAAHITRRVKGKGRGRLLFVNKK